MNYLIKITIHDSLAILASGATGQLPPSFKGDVPDEDVHENTSGNGPAQPSAPPISGMDRVTGYEDVGFQSGK